MPTTSTRSASSTKSSMSSTTWLTEPSISASSSVFVSSSSPFTSHFARCVSFTFVIDHLSVSSRQAPQITALGADRSEELAKEW
ncbi:hypothetical protein C4D60_Mb01t25130 [Musa balbisiana]|uniref:Uncharacterized protein n=1 Tax=Musa balbisiana TaxID=52838 RepID=A0A4S8JPQ1_MUSBA|nr:hypothetical protein C4D60_Mb01t25130 [Musa balbisiana]